MSLIYNKRALHDYTVSSTLVAGVVLMGGEVKSLRLGHGSLTGSHVKIMNHQVVLLGAQINPYRYADNRDYDPKRTRQLLLKKSEIARLESECDEKGFTIIPLSWQAMGRHLKLTIGLAKGKKQYEKREVLKRRSIQREVDREVKQRTTYRG